MTENKRYVVRSMFGKIFIEDDIKRVGVLIGYEEDGKKNNIVKVTNVLNQLNDENEQLKSDNKCYVKRYSELFEDYIACKKENEQLKSSGQYWYNEHKRIVKNYVNKIKEVEKENEQLKSELSEKDIQLDFLKDENKHMRDLVNENEQLKQTNQRLNDELQDCMGKLALKR